MYLILKNNLIRFIITSVYIENQHSKIFKTLKIITAFEFAYLAFSPAFDIKLLRKY